MKFTILSQIIYHFARTAIDTVFCLLSICMPDIKNFKNINFSLGWEHRYRHGTIHLGIEPSKCIFRSN